MPIRGSIPRPPRPEQDVKLLSLQARSPSLPPCPHTCCLPARTLVASLPAHVCTYVLTACVLCCHSPAAAIAIAIDAINTARAAAARRQSAAAAIAIAIAATAIATAVPQPPQLFHPIFFYAEPLFEQLVCIFFVCTFGASVIVPRVCLRGVRYSCESAGEWEGVIRPADTL